jgi:hypothetical protein
VNGARIGATIGKTGARADVCSGALTGARTAANDVAALDYSDKPHRERQAQSPTCKARKRLAMRVRVVV